MPQAEPVLICALSGRALAQAARAAGFAPIVLDAFGDLDTRHAATGWLRVPVDQRWRLRRGPLLAAAARLAPGPIPLVWGSGFERATALLTELAEGRPLWGNTPAVVRSVKDPFAFAAALQRLGLAHPEIRDRPPASLDGWLCKRAGGAGGGHVRAAGSRAPHGRGWYWQWRAGGRPVSALMLGSHVLGLSEQWAAPRRGQRFRYAGAVTPAGLAPRARDRLLEAATRLAAHFALRGLGSVDALVAGDEVTVLEVNPRPGATLDIFRGGLELFRCHVDGCRGLAVAPSPSAGSAAGSLIVYADRTIRVMPGFLWPAWAADRTPVGTLIRSGGPICTVLAESGDPASARELLHARACAIQESLTLAAGRRSSVG
jgi:predicted ATP-grasp superfamily ATP-dependent carboligase